MALLTAFGISALAGASAGAYSAYEQKKLAARQRRDFLGAFNESVGRMDLFHQQQRAYGNRAMAETKEGFERARELATAAGQTQRQGIMDRSKVMQSAAMQDLAGRGMGGTTIAPNMMRGVNADTSRQLLAVDESVARMRQGLETQSGLAGASSNWNMANMLGGQASQTNALFGTAMTGFKGGQVGGSGVAQAAGDFASILPYLMMAGGGGGG